MTRRVLITGASGFIGGALSRSLLKSGDLVYALVRDEDPPKGCRAIRGRLESLDDCRRAVKESKPDLVYHLGAQALVEIGHCDPLTTFASNVQGTWNLLYELMGPTRIVVASSDKAYGELLPGHAAYREEHPLRGRGIYDCSKSCADLISQSFAHEYCMDIRIARLGNVYGPGDPDESRIVPSIVRDIAHLRTPVVNSDGTPVRDYIYIDDAVEAYRTLGDWDAGLRSGDAFNFAGGEPLSVLDLTSRTVEIASKLGDEGIYAGLTCLGDQIKRAGVDMEPKIRGLRGRANSEISRQILECSKARVVLGWSPKVPLSSGLRKTLEVAWRARHDLHWGSPPSR